MLSQVLNEESKATVLHKQISPPRVDLSSRRLCRRRGESARKEELGRGGIKGADSLS